jgi:hypothetical protein
MPTVLEIAEAPEDPPDPSVPSEAGKRATGRLGLSSISSRRPYRPHVRNGLDPIPGPQRRQEHVAPGRRDWALNAPFFDVTFVSGIILQRRRSSPPVGASCAQGGALGEPRTPTKRGLLHLSTSAALLTSTLPMHPNSGREEDVLLVDTPPLSCSPVEEPRHCPEFLRSRI